MSHFAHETALVETLHIGQDTRIWAFAHVLPGARIGRDCNICDHTFIENDVVVGDRVTIKCGVQLWDGLRVEDDVFIGPNATFTNDRYPRSKHHLAEYPRTIIRRGASIGANATIVPGVEIGEYAMIGAGAVVTHNAPPHSKVVGNPSRIVGYVDAVPEVSKEELGATALGEATVLRLPKVQDLRGSLVFGEAQRDVPFEVKRYFLVFEVHSEHIRGEHAHRRLHQFLICVAGRCHVVTDDGEKRHEVVLDSPAKGVHIPPMVWATQYRFSSDAVLLVLASEHYDASDYIRDYQEYLALRRGTLPGDGERGVIPANDFGRQWEEIGSDVLAAIERVGRSGWYVLGEEVRLFEQELAEYWPPMNADELGCTETVGQALGLRRPLRPPAANRSTAGLGARGSPRGCPTLKAALHYAVGVASGLDAIEIGLRVLGCGPGDLVLTTPLSAFATTLAIVRLGAVPVFVDTDTRGLIDLERSRDAIRRLGIRYFVPVHLYGQALDLGCLQDLREEFDLRIVEDCAQSIGARFGGRSTGTVGQIAATSFYPTKNLGAMGDGGAILTSDAELAAQARILRFYGETERYRHEQLGYNSRLDEVQAALLRQACLPRLDQWLARRRVIAHTYRDGIRHRDVMVPEPPDGSESSWHLFPIQVAPARRASLLEHLKSAGIGAGIHYPTAIPDQPALVGVAYEMADDCATARRIAVSEVSLPVHPYLTGAEVERVIEAVEAW